MRRPLVAALALAAGLIAAGAPAQAPQASPGDPAAGADIYSARCAFCHGDGGAGGQGPRLSGVVGRKAAAVADFPYSAALKASGLDWTAANLDRFLTDPAAAVPGTAMPMSVPDPKERADVIAYLGTLH